MVNCLLIGENDLVIQCAEMLTENGFNVWGIISKFFEVENFSRKENIPFFNSIEKAKDSILKSKIDYFFSVVNNEVIPSKIINHINKLCINYHDGPLPKYAGVNATC